MSEMAGGDQTHDDEGNHESEELTEEAVEGDEHAHPAFTQHIAQVVRPAQWR
jgi:hypothetical protein